MHVAVLGAAGKLGRYMVQHALDRGHEVVAVCHPRSVGKLDAFQGRITVVPRRTDDREVVRRAVAGCYGALTVLYPWRARYPSGTAQAVLDYCARIRRLPPRTIEHSRTSRPAQTAPG